MSRRRAPLEQANPRGAFALDGLNLFIANVQTAFGPFVAVYLVGQKWTQVEIGLALSAGTIAAIIGQLPAGLLVDAIRDKRLAAGAGLIAVALASLLTAAFPARLAITLAQLLHGVASCLIGPAVAAISLGLVGIEHLGTRLGRNARYGAIGNAAAAVLMGAAGSLISERAVFILAAMFTLPALACLRLVPRPRLFVGPLTRGAITADKGMRAGLVAIATPALAAFAVAVFLFHLSNAAMLPLASVALTRSAGAWSSALIAACILVPQMLVAAMSPSIGDWAERYGRRIVLIMGFAAVPARALIFATLPDGWVIVGAQLLDGVSAASFGVMVPLVAADLTRGTGRYNLVQGALGLVAAAGATLSTTLAGFVAYRFGDSAAFLLLASAGGLCVLGIVFLLPETRPGARKGVLF